MARDRVTPAMWAMLLKGTVELDYRQSWSESGREGTEREASARCGPWCDVRLPLWCGTVVDER